MVGWIDGKVVEEMFIWIDALKDRDWKGGREEGRNGGRHARRDGSRKEGRSRNKHCCLIFYNWNYVRKSRIKIGLLPLMQNCTSSAASEISNAKDIRRTISVALTMVLECFHQSNSSTTYSDSFD